MNRKSATQDHPGADDAPTAAIMHLAAEWKARVDAGLSQGEEADLRAWLAADRRHRSALARFDQVWDRFDRPFHAAAADELLEELNVRARYRRRRLISAVAGLAVIFALASVWRFEVRRNPLDLDGVEAKTKPTATTVLRLQAQRILPDGSVVELKDGAEIAVDFSDPGLRRVTLRNGEAHFQVTKDARRPFVVSAGGMEVRAVGTMFAVQLRPAAVEILVTEGRVAVNQTPAPAAVPGPPAATANPAAPEPLAMLDAGHGIVVDISSPQAGLPPHVTELEPKEFDESLAWRAPRVEFTRSTLGDAIAVLNGYSAGRRSAGQRSIQFVIEDPALADVRLSGLFRVDKTEAFVGLLKNGFGIEAEQRGDSEIVLRKAR